ncbi:MAG: hypothetical protein JWO86_5947 [Myxococcaceae bacterium]|nr:hypothetical protein [Myxococcaceae bacterium]
MNRAQPKRLAWLAGALVAVLLVLIVRSRLRLGVAPLTWEPCEPGQMRPGHGCGEGMRFQDAQLACAAPRRLPTENELRGLMGPRGCKHNEACRSLYGEDDGIYWSSTVDARGEVRVAWFFNGDVTSDPTSSLNLVKCVREKR